MKQFLDLGKLGQNSWVRYVGSFALLAGAFVFGGMATVVATILLIGVYGSHLFGQDQLPPLEDALATFPPTVQLVLTLGTLLLLLAALWIAVTKIHERRFISLISSKQRINWQRVGTGALTWLLLGVVAASLDPYLGNGELTLSFELNQWLPYALVAIVIIPLAAWFEELFVRGYLTQALGLLTPKLWVLLLLPNLLFAVLHLGNPETVGVSPWIVIGNFLLFGILMTAITFRTGTLELALGVHAGNNLVSLVIGKSKLCLARTWHLRHFSRSVSSGFNCDLYRSYRHLLVVDS